MLLIRIDSIDEFQNIHQYFWNVTWNFHRGKKQKLFRSCDQVLRKGNVLEMPVNRI